MTPLSDYDFIIHLKKDYPSTAPPVFKNLRGESWKDVLVDFHPVRDYIKDLEVISPLLSKLILDVFWRCNSLVL